MNHTTWMGTCFYWVIAIDGSCMQIKGMNQLFADEIICGWRKH